MLRSVKLKDISKFIGSGITPLRANRKYWNDGIIYWLKTEQLGEHKIYKTSEKISQIALDETKIKVFPINTLSIAMYGEGRTRGNVSILKNEMTTNQACCNIIIDDEKADYEYVYYNLKTQYHQLRALSSGVRKNLNSNDIKEFKVRLPESLIEQKKISSVLSALDSKIEINNRINAELEAMAKMLYDYWFVQFEFPSEALAKDGIPQPYKSSGGKMVWDEELKREIPEGWEVKRIGDFGVFKNGINYDPSLEGNTDAKIINVRNISSSNLFVSQFDLDTIRLQKSNVDNYLVTDKDILIARSGIPGATRMMLEFAENTIYCGFIIRFQVNRIIEKNYIFYFLKAMEKNTTSKSGGTIMQNINQDTMKRMLVIEPNENIVIKFNDFINPVFRKMNEIIQENQKLTELRDWLLPMLMNGQVKVK
jgi:type I restriction enzyme, S subunit